MPCSSICHASLIHQQVYISRHEYTAQLQSLDMTNLCLRRATSLEQGKTRPSDTLDYETGDVSILTTLILYCCTFCSIPPNFQQSLLLCICWMRQSAHSAAAWMHWMHMCIYHASGCRSVTVHHCECKSTVLLKT